MKPQGPSGVTVQGLLAQHSWLWGDPQGLSDLTVRLLAQQDEAQNLQSEDTSESMKML